MMHSTFLTGVGGEGVITASVILARAANIAGHKVCGMQIHGLAQRGGSIPVHVRLGDAHSPTIPRAGADLILAFEPSEALKACYFADKGKTVFAIDTYPMPSVYTRLENQRYPSFAEIEKAVAPFSKKTLMVDASNICAKELGNPVYGNVMMLGLCLAEGTLPVSGKAFSSSLKKTFPRDIQNNLKAFQMGLDYAKKKK
jgi:indolepyruvate ferredoxin oxidoreductase beta subunit